MYTNVYKYIQIFTNISKYIQIYLNISKYIHIYTYISAQLEVNERQSGTATFRIYYKILLQARRRKQNC